jgi:spermidine/putrescine transport system permease protein
MLIAHVAYLTAYVILIVGARAARLDPDVELAAADLGAGPWRTLTRVILPDLRPAIGASALLVLAFSLDDVALSLALRGPTDTTLPVYLYSVVQRRVTPSIHAVGTLVVLTGAALFLAAFAIHNMLTDRARND